MNGQEFHERLHARAPWIEPHPEDPAHDEAVSKAVAGVFSGRVAEAIEEYNKWATGAGYQTLAVMSDGRIDIRSCVLRVTDNDFVVQKRVSKDTPDALWQAVCEGMKYVNEDEFSWYLESA